MPSILNASSSNETSKQSGQVTATTTLSTGGGKVDCAKECPCGGPAIPVPDQWLEVMVTGGFKVWHIIFIIIALIVTLVVVYCCFHRCRIPRTKQEIEADLMRTNMTNKFREYLQELPSEQTTFVEALKKVKEMEEKVEQDDALYSRDAGVRKRMGWLKLKGKDKASPETAPVTSESPNGENPMAAEVQAKANDAAEESSKPEEPSSKVESDKPVLQQTGARQDSTSAPDSGLLVPPKQPEESKPDDDQIKQQKPRQARPRKKPKPSLSRTKVARKDSSTLELALDPAALRPDEKPSNENKTRPSEGTSLKPPPAEPTADGKHHSKHHRGHRARSASKNATQSHSKEPDRHVPDKDNNQASNR